MLSSVNNHFKVLFCLFLAFLSFSLISCGEKVEKENMAKYELVGTIMANGEMVSAGSDYNYYYISFNNGIVNIKYNKKNNNTDMETVGSYEKRENVYVANIEGLAVNYEIKSGVDLECKMFGMTLKFKLVTE